jgi:hypothetical protein
MLDWWSHLSHLNQTLYGIAACISVPFAWQLIASLVGLAHDVDSDGMDTAGTDAVDTVLAFKLLSMRALLTFFTLFFWAAALYLEREGATSRVFGIAALWGLAGMSAVAGLLHVLPKLAHAGTRDLESALNAEASVYLDIPANATGEIRVVVSGSVCHVKARSIGGEAIPAGTPVTVCSRIGQTILIVKPLSQS